jgi:hypothetical protein
MSTWWCIVFIFRIKVVSYSLAGLGQSLTNQNDLQAYSQELKTKAARTEGVTAIHDPLFPCCYYLNSRNQFESTLVAMRIWIRIQGFDDEN